MQDKVELISFLDILALCLDYGQGVGVKYMFMQYQIIPIL
jgi:hypothetical protein